MSVERMQYAVRNAEGAVLHMSVDRASCERLIDRWLEDEPLTIYRIKQ